MPSRRRLAVALVFFLAAVPAFAHVGDGGGAGFVPGVQHPFGGLDHLLVMVAVGLWAVQLGGRALWAVPAAFVAVMAAGGALGVAGVGLPGVEAWIAASAVVLGLAVAFAVKAPVAAGAALVGLFALFHGHAHGSELPAGASGLAFGLGFALATTALHGAGLAAGLYSKAVAGRWIARAGGAVTAAAGLFLLVG